MKGLHEIVVNDPEPDSDPNSSLDEAEEDMAMHEGGSAAEGLIGKVRWVG